MPALRPLFEWYKSSEKEQGCAPIIECLRRLRRLGPGCPDFFMSTDGGSGGPQILQYVKDAVKDWGFTMIPGIRALPAYQPLLTDESWDQFIKRALDMDSAIIRLELEEWMRVNAANQNINWEWWVSRLAELCRLFTEVWAHHPHVLWRESEGGPFHRANLVELISRKCAEFKWGYTYHQQPVQQEWEPEAATEMRRLVHADRLASVVIVGPNHWSQGDWRDAWQPNEFVRELKRGRFIPHNPIVINCGAGGIDNDSDLVSDRVEALRNVVKLLRPAG